MSIRQEKYSRLLQKDLGELFRQHSNDLFEGQFITVSNVEVSPDLGNAKVYLSFFNAKDKEELMGLVEFHAPTIRKKLASQIRKQVRKIPELAFYIDNSLDHAMHMEEVFKNLNQKKS